MNKTVHSPSHRPQGAFIVRPRPQPVTKVASCSKPSYLTPSTVFGLLPSIRVIFIFRNKSLLVKGVSVAPEQSRVSLFLIKEAERKTAGAKKVAIGGILSSILSQGYGIASVKQKDTGNGVHSVELVFSTTGETPIDLLFKMQELWDLDWTKCFSQEKGNQVIHFTFPAQKQTA